MITQERGGLEGTPAHLLRGVVFSTAGEPHTLHMSEAAELSRGGIAEGRVLVDCWVGVSGRGPPWELLSSW